MLNTKVKNVYIYTDTCDRVQFWITVIGSHNTVRQRCTVHTHCTASSPLHARMCELANVRYCKERTNGTYLFRLVFLGWKRESHATKLDEVTMGAGHSHTLCWSNALAFCCPPIPANKRVRVWRARLFYNYIRGWHFFFVGSLHEPNSDIIEFF